MELSGCFTAILQRQKLHLKHLIVSAVYFSVKLDLDFLGVSCSPLAHPYIGINVCKHNVLFCYLL